MRLPHNTDELTTKMHAELHVSVETYIKHITWMVLWIIRRGLMSRVDAMSVYGITDSQIVEHKVEYYNLIK
ncbi:hypothetical protein [Pedobacter immunditicola]|uniref:hypothetical protein n=1 Tax=Pedobacter immunditicola TaxID=3133440 RepID=UPI0030AC6B92